MAGFMESRHQKPRAAYVAPAVLTFEGTSEFSPAKVGGRDAACKGDGGNGDDEGKPGPTGPPDGEQPSC